MVSSKRSSVSSSSDFGVLLEGGVVDQYIEPADIGHHFIDGLD